MNKSSWQDQFRIVAIDIYGLNKGLNVSNVLLPSFLNDFKSMLSKSKENQLIHEEYCSEDRLITTKLSGEKLRYNGKIIYVLRNIEVNNKFLELSDIILNSKGWII